MAKCVELGDSDLPTAPQSGGSGLATSLGAAIHDGARNLLVAFLSIVADDHRSAVTGRIANAKFGDYTTPVNADVPELDVAFVGEPDRFN